MVSTPFSSVLVANRGEIACRVIGTLRRLGVRSVAVHSDADADARHVREADVAVRIGPALAVRSYLDVEAVVAAAVATGAEAIHPGYGFLSENPALVRACERAGIAFVGPPAAAMTAMADKAAAKRLVADHGVPVLAGTMQEGGDDGLDDAALLAAAEDVGLPLLVKPVAGGGGKGMVVVRSAAELPDALASARRVAASSFGDDGLLLERLVDRPRHVEVQVLADAHGTVVHLGERECTLQRRHQKVVEEAPSPALDDATRARMGDAACQVARAVGYVGAGTVEFLVPADDPASFAFIEMNTRLQVEHPVTELVTGVDLVEAQLRVAAGEPLWFAQDDVRLTGHAIEARLYAESPARGFLPATGRVAVYDDAGAGAGPGAAPLRLDSGVDAGSEVTGDYDPMLAKAVAHGADREQALARLDGLLGDVVVLGVETNAGFLRDLLADPDVRAGRLDTGLIERHLASAPELSGSARRMPRAEPDNSAVVAAALLALAGSDDGGRGPWAPDGWRLNAPAAARTVVLRDADGTEHDVVVRGRPDGAEVTVDEGDPVRAAVRPAPGDHRWSLTLDATTRVVVGTSVPTTQVWVHVDGRTASFTVLDRAARAAERRDAAGSSGAGPASTQVRVDMPGTVTAVPAADGDAVTAGQTVVVVEAMKMEHALVAPADGVVHHSVRPGDQVRRDQVVAVVEPADTSDAPDTSDGSDAAHPAPESSAPAAAHPAAAGAHPSADPATRGAT
ncbi:biotin carboxylase N-terminal domain-containing protein [Isoptericola sp. BMS4]|uniref:ATP-binding protein n=1 Tax=Isoptericola sp. BMS4 TaxID=2527875 RepID=UPI00141DD9B9|nr:biotin carboxylase N-terminal domain-containing protein [Isoptericola sp. BMS4]